MPLLQERIACLHEAGKVLYNVSLGTPVPILRLSTFQRFGCSFQNCLKEADGSATALVNIIADAFPCFRDEVRFEGKVVHFYKRAQILVADLWACFDGKDHGYFKDIDSITMFAGTLPSPLIH